MRLDGWKAGKKKPDNMYKHFHDLGLVVIFPARRNGYSFVADDDFYGPFPTQERAQMEAEALDVAVRQLAREAESFNSDLADSQDEKERNTIMTETAPAQPTQYVSRAAYDKLAAYTKQLAAEHNKHEERIVALETTVKDLTNILTEMLVRAGDPFAAAVTELERAVAEEKGVGA